MKGKETKQFVQLKEPTAVRSVGAMIVDKDETVTVAAVQTAMRDCVVLFVLSNR